MAKIGTFEDFKNFAIDKANVIPSVIDSRQLQSSKALLPIVLTLLPIVTVVRLLQCMKAHSPIVSTVLPIVTFLRFLRLLFQKALFSMVLTPSANNISLIVE